VVFVDPHQGNKDVMPFSLPTTKAYVDGDRDLDLRAGDDNYRFGGARHTEPILDPKTQTLQS
jgi:hypothetical protein